MSRQQPAKVVLGAWHLARHAPSGLRMSFLGRLRCSALDGLAFAAGSGALNRTAQWLPGLDQAASTGRPTPELHRAFTRAERRIWAATLESSADGRSGSPRQPVTC